MKKHEKSIPELIEKEIQRLREPQQIAEPHLYLTKRQYEDDPTGWHDVLRNFGLPDDAIIIIPDIS